MKWFYNWLHTKLQQAEQEQNGSVPSKKLRIADMLGESTSISLSKQRSRHFEVTPMTFNVYPANGGWAIEYNYYDHKNDNVTNRLHVVPHDADLAGALEKIINYELLVK